MQNEKNSVPLYVAILDFFAKNPDYKMSADEFVSLVSILAKEVEK